MSDGRARLSGSGPSTRHPRLEVVAGPMFSGKSAELVRRVRLAEIARLDVRVFRPVTDTRSTEEIVFSRNGTQVGARLVAGMADLFRHLPACVEVVGIDEAQFFGDDLVDAVRYLLATGRRVIVAGLDLDFAGRPFGPMPALLALADTVDKLTAVCMQCHSLAATRTQRLVGGRPATVDSPQVLVDAPAAEAAPEANAEVGAEAGATYEARCVDCYQPPASAFATQQSYWSTPAG